LRSFWSDIRADKGLLLLGIAIGLIGGTMIEERASWLTISLLGIATAALVACGLIIRRGWDSRVTAAVAVGALTLIVAGTVVRFSASYLNVPEILVTQVLASTLGIGALLAGVGRRRQLRLLAVVVLVLVSFYGFRFSVQEPIDIDVYLLHEAAADALRDGQNPYTTGNVQVLESLRFDEKDLILEYTYPPLTLVAYAGSSILLGDSRFAGAIAIVGSFWLVFALVGRREKAAGHATNLDLAIVALLCVNPMNYLMIYPAWTEAIALPFLILAAAFWTKRPLLAAAMLGLAFATKQYFIVVAPLLFLLPDEYRWKRAVMAVCVAAATFVPFLLWDARGLWAGVVEHHLTRSPRADAATVAGVDIIIPTIFTVLVAVAVALVLSRRVATGGQLLIAIGAVVALFTFLSVRGFRNTWWLVAVLGTVALGFGQALEAESEPVEVRARSA